MPKSEKSNQGKYAEKLKPKRNVGKPLPDEEALRVEPFTKEEIDRVFEESQSTSLQDLLDKFGLTIEDIDEY